MIATFPASKTPRLALVFLIGMLTTLASCQKSKTNSTTALAKRPKIDPCGLISAEEVQAIQGSPIKDVKPSEQSDGSFRIAQCFYNAETFNKSVSLAVTQRDPASDKARNPQDFWKETFGRYEGEVKEEKGDEEKRESLREQEEEKGQPPKKIEGIGDDAYWTANRMGGALYVLKNDVFIRIKLSLISNSLAGIIARSCRDGLVGGLRGDVEFDFPSPARSWHRQTIFSNRS